MVKLFYYEDFREPKAENRVLSNFFKSPIKVRIPTELDPDGRPVAGKADLGEFELPTAEHLFQALKFSQNLPNATNRLKAICETEKPDDAKAMARRPNFKPHIRPN